MVSRESNSRHSGGRRGTTENQLLGAPLVEAVRDEDGDKMVALLSKTGSSDYINNQDEDGNTALHMSIGNHKFVKKLLAEKANCNIENAFGETPLHIAATLDLVETLVLLIVHGADVGGTNVTTFPRPSEDAAKRSSPSTAAKEANSKGCLIILLFCGAEFPASDEADDHPVGRNTGKLTEQQREEAEEREKHCKMLHGYRKKKVTYCGANYGSNEGLSSTHRKDVTTKLGLSIQLQDNGGTDFLFLCRRVDSSFQTSSASYIPVIEPEAGETLISDIYQYIVVREGTCDIGIQVFVDSSGQLLKYKDIVLVQVMQNKDDDSKRTTTFSASIRANQADFKDVVIRSDVSGSFVSMAVFSKNKVQTIDVRHDAMEEQTFFSQVEPKFEVTLSPQTLDGVGNVDIEVVKVEQAENQQSEVTSSNFCSILSAQFSGSSPGSRPASTGSGQTSSGSTSTASTVRENNSIILPLPDAPKDRDTKSVVVRCPPERPPEGGASWEPAVGETRENHTNGTLSIKGKDIGFGRYIVLVLKSIVKFGYKSKLFVHEMYMKAIGITAKCILFAAVKQGQSFEYLVNVTLCTKQQQNFEIEQNEMKGFFLDKCSRIDMKVNTKDTYFIALDLKRGKPFPNDSLPIKYQENQAKCHTYSVDPSNTGTAQIGYISVYKKVAPEEQRNKSSVAVDRFPVYFDFTLHIERKSFPSDAFIHGIASQLGEHYFAFGIYLDLPATWLQLLDDVDAKARSNKVLFEWRKKFYPAGHDPDIEVGLSTLFIALNMARRMDLMSKVGNEIQRSCLDNSREKAWLSGFKSSDGYSFRELKMKSLSPFGDIFLYKAAEDILTADAILLQQGVESQRREAVMQSNKMNRCRKAFEILLMARQKDDTSPPTRSVKTLIKSTKDNGMNVSFGKIGKRVEPWYRRMMTQENPEYSYDTLEKIKQIFEFK